MGVVGQVGDLKKAMDYRFDSFFGVSGLFDIRGMQGKTEGSLR